MSMIRVEDLTFSYLSSPDFVFEYVSFQIDTDWKLGFVGRNGRGKTTFLNLLLGKYEYRGTIQSSVEFDYFPYPVPHGERLAAEVLEEICPQAQEWELLRELSYLEMDGDALWRPFHSLSNGEQTKLLLAALFLNEGHFLLIDEPTNHLDLAAREAVSAYLKRKRGYILVSHDRCFLDGCVDHILSINRTNIEVQSGNFSAWLSNFEQQQQSELAQNQRLQKDIKRLQQSSRRTSAWSDQVEALKISPLFYHTDLLALCSRAAPVYDGEAACRPVSFEIRQGDRIALAGKNGSGKTSLLKLLAGLPLTFCGTVKRGSGLIVSYVPQDTAHLRGTLSDFAREQDIEESLFKAILRKMDFERAQFEKRIEDFSAGQKKKVLLAGSLCQKAHLYLWDEPLNYIDLYSRMQIERLIQAYAPTIVFVEHDMAFQNAIATKTVHVEKLTLR
ncbi:MAG: ABC-F family ATP-binding cassette domain-containing protein [Clostridiales bacterium]|nr:ABC-F family ATP-binding cassette domain-containing protein [Clostridiales bacterium]